MKELPKPQFVDRSIMLAGYKGRVLVSYGTNWRKSPSGRVVVRFTNQEQDYWRKKMDGCIGYIRWSFSSDLNKWDNWFHIEFEYKKSEHGLVWVPFDLDEITILS